MEALSDKKASYKKTTMPVVFLCNGIKLGVVKYTKIDQGDQFIVAKYLFN